MPSFERTLSVRLVVIGCIVVIVPFFALLLFNMLVLLTSEDIVQISIIPVSLSAAFLQWRETASRVPVQTLSVVMIMTPCLIIKVECRVHHSCCVQHCLESLHMSSNLLIVFWQVGG
jgi:hypothetical protein